MLFFSSQLLKMGVVYARVSESYSIITNRTNPNNSILLYLAFRTAFKIFNLFKFSR